MKERSILLIAVFVITSYGCRHSENINNLHTAEDALAYDHEKHAEPFHTMIRLEKRPFSFSIRTGGLIMAGRKDIEVVTAKTAGIVKFNNSFLLPGVKASKGEHLFTVSGEQLAYDNTELDFQQLTADLEKAAANYERAKSLIDDRIITREHYLELKNEYDKKLNEHNNLSRSTGNEGSVVSSPGNGYIREIFVTEGQKVMPGQPLATLVSGRNLILKAEVSPSHQYVLSNVESASFKVGYSNKLFKTNEMNGKLISSGRSTGDESFYVPVYFMLDYDADLIENTFAEVYLIGRKASDAIVVPNSALMEEYGNLYVFVEAGEKGFMKRYVRTGNTDGEFTEIIEGLSENETIVATGANNVRLSLQGDVPPAHGHNH